MTQTQVFPDARILLLNMQAQLARYPAMMLPFVETTQVLNPTRFFTRSQWANECQYPLPKSLIIALVKLFQNIIGSEFFFETQGSYQSCYRMLACSAFTARCCFTNSVHPVLVLCLNKWTYRHFSDDLVGASF